MHRPMRALCCFLISASAVVAQDALEVDPPAVESPVFESQLEDGATPELVWQDETFEDSFEDTGEFLDAATQEAADAFVPELTDQLRSNISLEMQFQIDPVVLDISEELQTAKAYYQESEWQQAVGLLEQFIRDKPKHKRVPDARFLLGESLMQLNRYTEAADQFRQLLASTPNFSQTSHARFRIAEALMLGGDTSNARVSLEQFRTDYPQHDLNAYALPYLAEIVSANGSNTQWAKSLYEEAIRTYPKGPLFGECQLRLALLNYQQQDYTKSNEILFRMVESTDRSEPDYWNASYWLGMTSYQKKQWDEAAERFLELIEAQPKHEFAPASAFHAAQAYRQLGKPAVALDLYSRIRSEWPDSEYVQSSLLSEIRTARELGQWQHSLEVFGEIRQNGDEKLTREATQIMVEILLAEKRYEEANKLIQPLAEKRRSLVSQENRHDHHTNLYLYALAQRGLGRLRQSSQLLGRVRLDMVSPDVAERVMLARMETFNAEGDSSAAIQEAYSFESRFSYGELLPKVRTQMVRAMVAANRVPEAKIKFRQMVRQGTDAEQLAVAAGYLAKHTYNSDDLATSRLIFESLGKASDDNDAKVEALSGLAWIAMKEGKHEEASRRFADFVDKYPAHPSTARARLALAQSYGQAGDIDQAITVLEFFANKDATQPFRPDGIYQLARLLQMESRDLARSATLAQTLVKDHETFPQRDAALYLLGSVRKQLGNADVVSPMQELVSKHPRSEFWSDALYRLADDARERKDFAAANDWVNQILAQRRDQDVLPHALYLKGRLQSEAKQWPDARKTLRELLRRFPSHALVSVARYGVAESFYQEGKDEHALKLFEILNRDVNIPDDEQWSGMIQLRRAQLFAKKQQWKAVTGVAQAIQQRFPEFSLQHEVDYVLGRAFAAEREFGKARESYGNVIAADPAYEREITAMAQWMMGETNVLQKRYVLAIKDFEALPINANPKWKAASRLAIGKCYEVLGDTEQAQSAYSRVKTRYSGTSYAKEAGKRMALIEKSL